MRRGSAFIAGDNGSRAEPARYCHDFLWLCSLDLSRDNDEALRPRTVVPENRIGIEIIELIGVGFAGHV